MGALLCCCNGSSTESELLQPDIETKRRQQAEAAEKRMREMESRGLRDPEGFKEKQRRLDELEKQARKAQNTGGESLKWTIS